MDQPIRYVVRDPLFISARLMPAVRVDDAAVHLHAVAVDADDGPDPRVVWRYLIDGPDLFHAGRDLTTPYLGPDTIADQLPTAVSTLLSSLSHAADADDRHPDLPDAVYRWARRHRDDLTAMADLVHDLTPQPMSATQVWRAITHDPDRTAYGQWCVAQAVAHADRIATLSAVTAAGLVVRDEAWHETALAWYTTLTEQPEPDTAPSVCVVADRDAIRAWLTTPLPDSGPATMADRLHLYDIPADRDDSPLLPELVEYAQHAGLFGVPGHTIRVHPTIEAAQPSHLLVVHTPTGAALAAGPLPPAHTAPGADPYDAAVTALRRCAVYVDRALAGPADATGPAGPGWPRPFPTLHTTSTAAEATDHTALPRPATPGRHRR